MEIPPKSTTTPVKEAEKTQEIISPEKLKVAEVLLGDKNFNIEDLYEKSKEGKGSVLNQDRAREKMKEVEAFSPEARKCAEDVVSAREESARVLEQAYEIKKRDPNSKKLKISDIISLFPDEQKNTKEKHENAVIALKKTILQDEIITLRQKHGQNPESDKLIREGIKNGTTLESIRNISVMELARMNDAREGVNKGNSKLWENIKKPFAAFAKIEPRALRSVVGSSIFTAGLIGGSVAFSIPIAAAAAGYGTYAGYRVVRALVGGTISAFVQKHVTNKIVESAYKVDTKKAFEDIKKSTKQSVVEQGISDELSEIVDLESLASQNFSTDKELAEEYSKKMKKARRLHTANAIGSGVITGAAGGMIGAKGLDFSIGKFDEFTGGGSTPEQIPGVIPKGEPEWESTTAQKGDSVWSVVEHDLEKNVPGFKDMTEAERTYVIDHYKDYVEADPEKFGLTNPDQIKIGWGKEVDSLFNNKQELAEIIGTAKGLKPEEVQNILRTNEWNRLHPDGISHEEVVPQGAQTPEELRPAFSPEDQRIYSQAMQNYRGGTFEQGSAAWNSAHAQGEQSLLALAHDHPRVMQNPAYQDFKYTVRNIFGEHLQKELGEGGMLKMFQSADHDDLVRETSGIAETFGLKPQEAQIYTAFLGQGHELDENTFKPFVNPETGEVSMKEFARSIGQFGAIAENNHDLPDIPVGKTVSAWEPRIIRVGDNNYLGLVRNAGEGKFEYSIEPGDVSGASKTGMELMLEQGAKSTPINAEAPIENVRAIPPSSIRGLADTVQKIGPSTESSIPKTDLNEPMKGVVVPENIQHELAASQEELYKTIGLQASIESGDIERIHNSLVNIGKVYGLSPQETSVFEQYTAGGKPLTTETMRGFVDQETRTPAFAKVAEAMNEFKEVAKRTELPQNLPGEAVSDWEPRMIKTGVSGTGRLGLVHKMGPNLYEVKVGNAEMTSLSRTDMQELIVGAKVDNVNEMGPVAVETSVVREATDEINKQPININSLNEGPSVEAERFRTGEQLKEEISERLAKKPIGRTEAFKVPKMNLNEPMKGVVVPENIQHELAASQEELYKTIGLREESGSIEQIHDSFVRIGNVYGLSTKEIAVFEQYAFNNETLINPETGAPSFAKVAEAMNEFKEVAKRTELPKNISGETYSNWEPRKLGIRFGTERIEELGLVRKTGPATYDMRIGNRALTSITEGQVRQAIDAGHWDDVIPVKPTAPMPPGSEQIGQSDRIIKGRSPENI
jgi:hypothetical protein